MDRKIALFGMILLLVLMLSGCAFYGGYGDSGYPYGYGYYGYYRDYPHGDYYGHRHHGDWDDHHR